MVQRIVPAVALLVAASLTAGNSSAVAGGPTPADPEKELTPDSEHRLGWSLMVHAVTR